MTASELAAALTARGVTFTVEGDRLRVEAPAGELTETDWTTLAAHKPALLALLTPALQPDGAPAELDTGLTVADVLRVFPDARVVTPEEDEPAAAPAIGYPYGPTPPAGPCPACGGLDWHRAGDGWTCSTCHPVPARADIGLSVLTLQAHVIELARAEGFPCLRVGHGHIVQPRERYWTHFTFVIATRPLLLRAREALSVYRAAGNGQPARAPNG
jgi:hypothetical protein